MSERSGLRADGSRARRAVRGAKPRAHLEPSAAGAALGGTAATVESLVKSGVLHPVEVDGKQVFRREDVERLLAEWGVQHLPFEAAGEDEFEQYLEPLPAAAGDASASDPAGDDQRASGAPGEAPAPAPEQGNGG